MAARSLNVEDEMLPSAIERWEHIAVTRDWCKTRAVAAARADTGLKSIGLYPRTLFRMTIERIDLDLSRLKRGFDSPRERQQAQVLS